MADTLGAKIDQLFDLRTRKEIAEAKVKSIELQEKALEDDLINSVKKADLNGAFGKKARVSLTQRESFSIKDFDRFSKWVFKNKALDVFQRRLSSTSIKDRRANGDSVPGIEVFIKVGLSLTKLSKK